MIKFTCMDVGGWPEVFEAESAQKAAEAYVAAGDWPESDVTWYVSVHVENNDGGGLHKVAVHPSAPACANNGDHDWARRVEVVGGLAENPGVHSSGNGGVAVTSHCELCGCKRVEDSGACDPLDGQGGLESIRYEPSFYEVSACG